MSDEVLALVTCPQEASDLIAEELINSQLVACVNIIPQIKSVYKWEGKLAKEQEALLIIKTNLRVWSQLESKIRSVHSYDVPEIICVPIVEGHKPYLDWLNSCIRKG